MRNSVQLQPLVCTLYLHVGSYQQLPRLLAEIAHALNATAAYLHLDLGNGYLHQHFTLPLTDSAWNVPATPPTEDGARPMSADAAAKCVAQRRAANGMEWVLAEAALPENHPVGTPACTDPWKDLRMLAAGTRGLRERPRSSLAVFRDTRLRAFTQQEREEMTGLVPHLEQVLNLTQQMETARQQQASAWQILERMHQGVLLLEADGRVIHATANAQCLLSQCNISRYPRLHFPACAMNERFATALGQATDALHPRASAVSVDVANEAEVLVMNLLPAPPASACGDGERRPQALALLRTSQRCKVHLSRAVLHHFGLTPAEARLCDALVSGMRLKICAQTWNLAYDTLRAQLKRIFEKTGVHRQAELVALLEVFRETGP